MKSRILPLKEVTINEIFIGGEKCVYEIPIYQRNYAWEKDEITTLIQDIYDAFLQNPQKPYYIGTLVSYHKGDQIYEIIDGQQRLTTIRLILGALDIKPQNMISYRARKKSDVTLNSIPKFDVEEKDRGIENGFKYAKTAIADIVPANVKPDFVKYFRDNVHIIHYYVPNDIDLNHYFEIMNSRGEQLEKHEILKAELMKKLHDKEQLLFNQIWECCTGMSVYVQQNLGGLKLEEIFGSTLEQFNVENFESMLTSFEGNSGNNSLVSISDIINQKLETKWVQLEEPERKDSFQPIIDFPNFLLIVLKITKLLEKDNSFDPKAFNLDDKELLNEFKTPLLSEGEGVKKFAYNLLKAKFLLDNYIVHHSNEDDKINSNPWKLQIWHNQIYDGRKRGSLKNLSKDDDIQNRLIHLLSMFEVSFTARQRKNYLFYCLLYLMDKDTNLQDIAAYQKFVENLANRYFNKIYLDASKLNAINTPLPGSFDEMILDGNKLANSELKPIKAIEFSKIYGDGKVKSNGIPLYIFNYLDFKLWDLYDKSLRGKNSRKTDTERKNFFVGLGCSNFDLNTFEQFYFSRTRRSLEHFYPQATATGKNGALDQIQINCLGNYAMIGSEINSSGSCWDPKTKLAHYLDDSSGKINKISVASLKFMIMMQVCKDRQKWEFEEIENHQNMMLNVLFPPE